MDRKVVEALNKKNVLMTFQSPVAQSFLKFSEVNAMYCSAPSPSTPRDESIPLQDYMEDAALMKVKGIEALYDSYGLSLDVIIGHEQCVQFDCANTATNSSDDDHVARYLTHRSQKRRCTAYVAVVIKMKGKIINIFDKTVFNMKVGGVFPNSETFDITKPNDMEDVQGDIFVICGVPLFKLNQELKNSLLQRLWI